MKAIFLNRVLVNTGLQYVDHVESWLTVLNVSRRVGAGDLVGRVMRPYFFCNQRRFRQKFKKAYGSELLRIGGSDLIWFNDFSRIYRYQDCKAGLDDSDVQRSIDMGHEVVTWAQSMIAS